MPRIRDKDGPKRFGHLKLFGDQKMLPRDTEEDEVHIYWDLNHCPLPASYDVRNLRVRLNAALRTLNGKLRVKHITFVGDKISLSEDQRTLILKRQMSYYSWKEGYERSPVCNSCQSDPNYKYQGKEGEAADAVLVREIIGHALMYKAPGYVMLVSPDVMFWSALCFLRDRGFKVLLAHDPASHPQYHTYADFTWLVFELMEGLRPKYKITGELDESEPIAIGLEKITDTERRIKPQPSERNWMVHGLWDVENTPLPNDYDETRFIANINLALSRFDNGGNVLKLSKLTVIGSDDIVNGLGQPARQRLKASGEESQCEVYCGLPDKRSRKCSVCHRTYNKPVPNTTPPTHQDQFTRVTDISDFMLTEQLMQYCVDFGAPGILLLFSGDKDFGPTLAFLRKLGFRILVAEPAASYAGLHGEAHLSWYNEGMRDGKAPVWYIEWKF